MVYKNRHANRLALPRGEWDARLIGGESRGHGELGEMGSRTLNCVIDSESNVFVVRVWPQDG